MYGESLRKLKEIRDELEQRQVDMDILEDELETQYAELQDQQEMLRQHNLRAENIKRDLEQEMRRHNSLHPSLKVTQLYRHDVTPEYGYPEEALRVKLLPPKVDWDEKEDRAYVKLTFSCRGYPETEVYAMSLGELDYINEDVLEGVVKETAEHINRELWQLVKKRNKNG